MRSKQAGLTAVGDIRCGIFFPDNDEIREGAMISGSAPIITYYMNG